MLDCDYAEKLRDEQLQRFLDHQVDAEEEAEIQRHVGECKSCQEALDRKTAPSPEDWPTLPDSNRELPARSPDPPAPDSPLPSITGYTLHEELAHGAMGVVYRAFDKRLKREVALKVIRLDTATLSLLREGFKIQAEAMACLHHPNIIPIYDHGESDGRHFIAMEYAAGGNLKKRLNNQPQPPDTAARLVKTLAQAMGHAHKRGVLHLDLKPANILFLEDGTPKVTDFGLAKRLDDGTRQKQPGALFATRAYMAPEQATPNLSEISVLTDVYGLGAILFELLTGRKPIGGTDHSEMSRKVPFSKALADGPGQTGPRLPRDLELICLKCLEREPQRRYASAEQLAEELCHYLDGEPLYNTRRVGRIERVVRLCRRNPAPTAAAGMAALALLAVVALVVGAFFTARLQEEKDRADLLAATVALGHGQTLGEEGRDPARGVLALARGLRIAPANAHDLRYVLRTNLASWTRQVSRLKLPPLALPETVTAVTLGPGETTILSGESDGTVRLWDLTTGEERSRFTGQRGPVLALALSPDGTAVLTGGYDGACLSDLPTGRMLRHFKDERREGFVALALSPDGKAALTGGPAGARLWERDTGRTLRHFPHGNGISAGSILESNTLVTPLRHFPHGNSISALAFSPDGKAVLTCDTDRNVRLWSLSGTAIRDGTTSAVNLWSIIAQAQCWQSIATGPAPYLLGVAEPALSALSTNTPALQFRHPQVVVSAAFGPDSRTVLMGNEDGTSDLWDSVTGTSLGTWPRQQGSIKAVAYGPRGKTILTLSAGKTARLWNLPPPPVRVLEHDGAPVWAVAISPDGRTALTGTGKVGDPWSGKAQLWDLNRGVPLGPPLLHDKWIKTVAFSPDGRLALTAGWEGQAKLWEVPSGRLKHTLKKHDRPITVAIFSPDGRTVLTASNDKAARLWDVATGQSSHLLGEHGGVVSAAAFSHDSRSVVTGSSDGVLHLWEAATGKELWKEHGHQGAINAVAFRAKENTFVTGSADGTSKVWGALADGTVGPRAQCTGHNGPVLALAISPDGEILLTGGTDGTARLWAVATGEALGSEFPHRQAVRVVAFGPDGRTALTASDDGTARLWDVTTRQDLGPSLLHNGPVSAAAFAPDGTRVLTSTNGGTARLWPTPGPLEGEAAWIALWLQVLTGLELDDRGSFRELDAGAWRERCRQLDERGGPPIPPG
jgi:WD40 repeat protein/predicted Ser/Thr protein kinase